LWIGKLAGVLFVAWGVWLIASLKM